MSTRKVAKTGKFTDARRAIELARIRVEECRADLFTAGGDFNLKVSALNLARIELVRKEEYLKELTSKANSYRDKIRA